MAGEWQLMTLRAANVTLIDCDHRTPPAAEDGYPYVAIPQMRGGRIELAGARRIGREHYLEWTRKAKPSANDVILSRRCNPGETAVAPAGAEFALGQNLVLLRADGTKVFPPFLRWLVRGPDWWEQIGKFNNVGAVFDSLKCADVPKFELRIPPLPEQRAIAHILGTLDDKIELNRRMNETLEAMARALFKSWFVDFDPVRAKMNLPSPSGRGAGGEGTTPAPRANAPVPTKLLDFARQLRGQATDAEALLWRLLRDRQIANAKFRRQHPYPPYILDFYCHELKLAVELDGGQHNEDAGRRKDARRDEYLAEHGIGVLRFWNNDVLRETEAVLEAIYAAVVEHAGGVPSPPAPLPRGAGSFCLPQPLAALSPPRLVATELGEIPEGWEAGRFGDVVEHLRDQENPLSFPDEVFHHFSIPAFDEGQTAKSEYGESIKSLKSRVPPGVILISKLNPEIERVWMVDVRPGERAVCSTEFLMLRARPPFTRGYLYCLARSPLFRQQIEGLVTGTSKSHQRAHVESILNLAVVIPPSSTVAAFDRSADGMLSRTLECRRESRTLAALRDTLLPKLISGELRVRDAEKFIGKAI
jgi:very-short-patch-repair endonuclease/restriction endonuclease S subunit